MGASKALVLYIYKDYTGTFVHFFSFHFFFHFEVFGVKNAIFFWF